MPKAASLDKTLPPPTVLSLLFTEERESFTHPVEAHKDWSLLGSLSGSFEFAIAQKEQVELCESGEFILCPPKTALYRKARGKMRFYFIQFRWKKEMGIEWRGKHSLTDLARMESTLSYLEIISSHLITADERRWANHLLSDLFEQRRHEQRSQTGRKLTGAPDRQMMLAAEQMRKELSSASNLDAIAAGMRLTPSQFSRRFKAAFGSNPSLYRSQLRMREARRLLVETSLSLEQIAETCGYENAFYFSRVFHALNGQPPSRFRKNLQV